MPSRKPLWCLFVDNVLPVLLSVIALIVVGLSIIEGMIALTLLNILSSEALWWSWFFGRVIPQAFYHGALTPLFLFGLNRLERRLTGWVQPRR